MVGAKNQIHVICILILIIILLLFVNGCSPEQEQQLKEKYTPEVKAVVKEAVKEALDNVSQSDNIVCNSPYIRQGHDCCLDVNNNSICDNDEQTINEEPSQMSDYEKDQYLLDIYNHCAGECYINLTPEERGQNPTPCYAKCKQYKDDFDAFHANVYKTVYSDITTTSTTTTLKPITLAPASDIIKAVVELRQQSNAKNLIKVSELVTYLNDQFTATNIDLGSWQTVLNCAYSKCDDVEYTTLINDYVRQNLSNNKLKLIQWVAYMYGLWHGGHRYITGNIMMVDDMVTAMNNTKVTEKWKALYSCETTDTITDTSCHFINNQNDFPDKIFDLILVINTT